MFKILTIFLMILTCYSGPKSEYPNIEKDINWVPYVIEEGIVLPNNVVAFYERYYPEYYSHNKALMQILSEQYKNRVQLLKGCNTSYFKYSDIDYKLEDKVSRIIKTDYNVESFCINGYRTIDQSDPCLFNRLYKWYNMGYSDGFYQDFWCDDDMVSKLGVSEALLENATLCVDCTITIDEDIKSEEVFYFDNEKNYLFKIIVFQ